MKPLLRVGLLWMLCATPTLAQFTIVTGTVTDTNGVPYAGGTISAQLVVPGGCTPTLSGGSFTGSMSPIGLDPTGSFTARLADNNVINCGGVGTTTWKFLANISVPPPLGTGPQTCTATLTITGASQSVTSSFNACPALSRSGIGGGAGDPPTTANATWTSATALNTALTVSTTGPSVGYGTAEASVTTSGILFGIQSVTDSFAYGNNTDLHTDNANWVYQTGSFNVTTANGPSAAYASANPSFAYRSDGPTGVANEYAQATVVLTATAGTQNGGICVRQSTAAQTGYCITAATDILKISRWLAGVQNTIADFGSNLAVTGDVLRIQAIGSTISLWKNGICLTINNGPSGATCGITDTNIATGSTGMVFAGNANANGISVFSSGTANATDPQLTFEVSDASGTWLPIQGKRPGASTFYDLTYDPVFGNQTWQFTTAGFSNFRVRLSAVILSGTLTITGQAFSPLFTNATPLGCGVSGIGRYVSKGQYLIENVTSILSLGSVSFGLHTDIIPINGGPPVRTTTTLTIATSAGNNITGNQIIPVDGCLQNISVLPGTSSPFASPGTYNILVYLRTTAPTIASFGDQSDATMLLSCNPAQNFTCSWPEGKNTLPQEVPGISISICASGCPLALTTPVAGANFSWNPAVSYQYRLKSITFTLTTNSTAANRTAIVQYTNNNGKVVWSASCPGIQSASDTVNYSFGQNSSVSMLNGFCSSFFPETVIDAGDNAGGGLDGITTIATLITNLQAGDTITNIVLNFEVKNGTD